MEAVRRAWEAGDAVLPLDQRTSPERRADLVRRAGAAQVVDASGEAHRTDGPPTALGDDDRLVAATSGSTGEPKLLVHTGTGLAAHARAVHDRLAVDPETDRWLACLPLDHLGGFGVVARSLLTGTPVDATSGFDARAVSDAPSALGSTLVSLVPTALDRLAPDSVASYRWILLGGAADRGERPANVVRTYGSTETCGGVVYDGAPLAGTEVQVAPDGTISLRGPSLARGLLAPDGRVAAIVDGDGWWATGDLGELDAPGHLVVHGRRDALIITGGENVWPEVVEGALSDHPLVAEVVVTGAPDPEWGERVVAVVVPADRGAPPTLEQLRAHAGALPRHALPRELRVVDRIERSALGKPLPGGGPGR